MTNPEPEPEPDQDSGLFAIELAASPATAASPPIDPAPRTFQSPSDFRAQKASYTAKSDTGNHYLELLTSLPALRRTPAPQEKGGEEGGVEEEGEEEEEEKVKLSKRQFQLLGFAVAEMYYDGEFGRVLEVCERVRRVCEVEGRVRESLGRWRGRCEGRIGGAGG